MMLHIWPRKPRHNGIVLRYTYWMPGNISTEREREKIIVIGIGDPNSGFDELSPDVVEDIFGLLLDDAFRPFQLVLLCDDDYAYQNRTLNQILCDAADARADIDDQQLMHRVWVAGRMIGHAALSNSNPELALFRLEADLVRERRRLVPV
ncbi:hypothetical protein BKA62DRAFT_411669 [Auriculariales sp. MPI-PUGE-AT-0066]|nr:hypothetical protein BKA62DRAFT_411669 [Auriculariales sp. MPI-PUGE-AT-0066]